MNQDDDDVSILSISIIDSRSGPTSSPPLGGQYWSAAFRLLLTNLVCLHHNCGGRQLAVGMDELKRVVAGLPDPREAEQIRQCVSTKHQNGFLLLCNSLLFCLADYSSNVSRRLNTERMALFLQTERNMKMDDRIQQGSHSFIMNRK